MHDRHARSAAVAHFYCEQCADDVDDGAWREHAQRAARPTVELGIERAGGESHGRAIAYVHDLEARRADERGTRVRSERGGEGDVWRGEQDAQGSLGTACDAGGDGERNGDRGCCGDRERPPPGDAAARGAQENFRSRSGPTVQAGDAFITDPGLTLITAVAACDLYFEDHVGHTSGPDGGLPDAGVDDGGSSPAPDAGTGCHDGGGVPDGTPYPDALVPDAGHDDGGCC